MIDLSNNLILDDSCLTHAFANMTTFIKELDLKDPPIAITMQSPDHDGAGYYQFDLHRGVCTVTIHMPGVSLDEVHCTEDRMPPGCPRLYVDGNSWWWCYALDFARTALEDHDGSLERRDKASEQAARAELDQHPRCLACNGARSLVVTKADLYAVRCYTCAPEIELRRVTHADTVYKDDNWTHVPHFLVKLQHMPPEVPGHKNPMHPDALCGAMLQTKGNGTCMCRRKRRHEGRCEPYWKEVERTLVLPGEVLS